MEPIQKPIVSNHKMLSDTETPGIPIECQLKMEQKPEGVPATKMEQRSVAVLEIQLDKATETKACREYLFSNLEVVLDAQKVLPDFLIKEILSIGAIKDPTIQTYVCVSEEEVTAVLNNIRRDECALIIYRVKQQLTELLTLSLIRRSDDSKIKKQVGSIVKSLVFSEMDFFVITFELDFDIDGSLKSVDLNRGVSHLYQKKGICTEISRKVLGEIYSYIGKPETKVYCDSACHIGTVKFFYPLNRFYYKDSKKSARNFVPGREYVDTSNFEKGDHCLDGLSYNPPCTTATCPDGWVNLKTLLLQYKVKDFLESR